MVLAKAPCQGDKGSAFKGVWGLPRHEIQPQEEGFRPQIMEKVLETQADVCLIHARKTTTVQSKACRV